MRMKGVKNVTTIEDLTGAHFESKARGYLIVTGLGERYDGGADIRITWNCKDKKGNIVKNIQARYLKRMNMVKAPLNNKGE